MFEFTVASNGILHAPKNKHSPKQRERTKQRWDTMNDAFFTEFQESFAVEFIESNRKEDGRAKKWAARKSSEAEKKYENLWNFQRPNIWFYRFFSLILFSQTKHERKKENISQTSAIRRRKTKQKKQNICFIYSVEELLTKIRMFLCFGTGEKKKQRK